MSLFFPIWSIYKENVSPVRPGSRLEHASRGRMKNVPASCKRDGCRVLWLRLLSHLHTPPLPPPIPPPPHYIVSAQKYLTEYLRATSSGKCELTLNKKQDHCSSEKQIHVKPCIFQNLISANCSHSTSQKQTVLVYRALETSCWLLMIIEIYIFK